jgi:hypothetical protein
MRHAVLLLTFSIPALLLAPVLHAQPADPATWEPSFLGYGTEPEMDYGGRSVMSLQSAVSRGLGAIGHIGEKHPGLAPAWEFPAAAALVLIQHEVDGHGGRAREFGLSPSYAFNYDFSAATGTRRPPRTNEGNALIGSGGTEADQVMAHRTLLDLLRPEGADGAKVPLLLISKLDLTVYVAQTRNPDRGESFLEQYRDGNDMAYYLLSRQAQRRGADPAAVWSGAYTADFADPLLDTTYDDMRATALWNLLDPTLAGAVFNYFRQHVLGGQVRVRAPVLRVAGGVGLALGTRGALGPQEVSRFLDLHAATRRGVLTVYVRDLDSSVDRTYGFGAAVHGFRVGGAELGLAADSWDEPVSRERLRTGNGWNATAEIDTLFQDRWGFSAKVGTKSAGFFPGLPIADGAYVGFGLRGVW